MKRLNQTFCAITIAAFAASAQNPLIHNQFTADPTARVFNGRIYLYPSHDIPSPVDKLKDWFCMSDYHVFSSDNLVDWTDHGVIVSQETVPWVKPDSYAMWAPDCVEKDGRYYFYFPAAPKDIERGFGVGVAVADDPAGPFIPEDKPIQGIMGIDPCVLVDDDGQSYIYWSGMGIRCARLSDDMKSIEGQQVLCDGLPDGFKEGPFAFKRDGIYYLTFPWVRNVTETLAYATADNPFGPFTFRGLIMEEHPSGCWTNHHSIVEFNGRWYLFYHHNDYSPFADKRRSACADELTFNSDGSINIVHPTLRGVGVSDARRELQIDRASQVCPVSTEIVFNNPDNTFDGWAVNFGNPGSWVKYDKVDFGDSSPLAVIAKVTDGDAAELLISVDAPSRKLAEIKIDAPGNCPAPVIIDDLKGVHDIYVSLSKGSDVKVDWVKFIDEPAEKVQNVECAGAGGVYFNTPESDCSCPDENGFIRRWWILDPIDKPNRSNTVFTDSYLREAFYREYFPGQSTMLPKKGQKVKPKYLPEDKEPEPTFIDPRFSKEERIIPEKLEWHNLESNGYNVHLYRFAQQGGKQVYGVLFNVVTVIYCPEEITDVRLSVGSNSASIWWLDGEEVLLMSGDRRMVADDAMSERITLHKGRNVLRGAVINGPGMSGFCVRFLDSEGNPVTNFEICEK